MSGCVGLWDTGGLLRVLRLLGDLSGVLLHLLPLIEQPIREGLQDDVRVNKSSSDSDLVPLEKQLFSKSEPNKQLKSESFLFSDQMKSLNERQNSDQCRSGLGSVLTR